MIILCCKKSFQTWCHRRPAETPTRLCLTAIRPEEDHHGVAVGHDDWRQAEAAALVHQGFPVLVFDLDMVACAVAAGPNIKLGKLQPQYLPNLNLYPLCPLNVSRVVVGVVWRGDNTCG